MHRLILTLVAAFGLIMSALSGWAQPKYLVTVIAPGNGFGINGKGEVCGTLSSDTHGFVYIKGKVTDLGVIKNPHFPNDLCMTEAYALNNRNMVVGHIADVPNGGTGILDSFLYKKGKMLDIARGSNDGGFSSFANGINNAGVIVGSYDAGGTVTTPPARPGSATARAYRYQNGQLFDLGTFGGLDSEAFGINQAGQVVGVATVSGNTAWDAFLYSNGKMQAIGGTASNRFLAYAINDNGWITGTLFNSPTKFTVPNGAPGPDMNFGFAALYVNGKLTSLSTLKGFTGSEGVAINNSGNVVGGLSGSSVSQTTGLSTGVFLYTGGKMYDLNSLVEGVCIVTEVGDINDAGQIAATITKPPYSATSPTYAALLNPVR